MRPRAPTALRPRRRRGHQVEQRKAKCMLQLVVAVDHDVAICPARRPPSALLYEQSLEATLGHRAGTRHCGDGLWCDKRVGLENHCAVESCRPVVCFRALLLRSRHDPTR